MRDRRPPAVGVQQVADGTSLCLAVLDDEHTAGAQEAEGGIASAAARWELRVVRVMLYFYGESARLSITQNYNHALGYHEYTL